MWNKTITVFGTAVMVLLLSGCDTLFGPEGYFRDRADDYLKAQTIEPIMLPEGVEGENLGQLFVVPPIKNTGSSAAVAFEVPRPASSEASSELRNEVKIQILGDRRWIAVNSAPGVVWPRVLAFLSEKGLSVAAETPSQGIIETDWLRLKDDASGKDRYRIQLQQGIRANTTEVHVLQISYTLAASSDGDVAWPAKSADQTREEWMVKEISAYLAKEDTTGSSMLAQAIGTNGNKVDLVSSADPYLAMKMDAARAWASVGGALNRDGFHIENANREQGKWHVTYSAAQAKLAAASSENTPSEAESPGVFSRIGKAFGIGSDSDQAADAAGYQVVLKEMGASVVHVSVCDNDGKPLPERDAERVLRLIWASLR